MPVDDDARRKARELLNAHATVRFILLDAITSTCLQTGLRASPAVEALLDAQMKALQQPATRWAVEALAAGWCED